MPSKEERVLVQVMPVSTKEYKRALIAGGPFLE
jgi:hypothetical protein